MKSLISSLAGARGRGEACLEQTPWRPSIGPRVQLQELFSKPFWIARWKQVRSLSLFVFRTFAKFERLLFCCDYLSDLVSVLSGKLDPPAYLQENKCSSYCLLQNVSWAAFFYFFQWACCDFVLTDWAVFHFAFIFHPVKGISSARPLAPLLPLAVCLDQCTEAVPPSLHCSPAARRAAELWAENPGGKLRSSPGHGGGQHTVP